MNGWIFSFFKLKTDKFIVTKKAVIFWQSGHSYGQELFGQIMILMEFNLNETPSLEEILLFGIGAIFALFTKQEPINFSHGFLTMINGIFAFSIAFSIGYLMHEGGTR